MGSQSHVRVSLGRGEAERRAGIGAGFSTERHAWSVSVFVGENSQSRISTDTSAISAPGVSVDRIVSILQRAGHRHLILRGRCDTIIVVQSGRDVSRVIVEQPHVFRPRLRPLAIDATRFEVRFVDPRAGLFLVLTLTSSVKRHMVGLFAPHAGLSGFLGSLVFGGRNLGLGLVGYFGAGVVDLLPGLDEFLFEEVLIRRRETKPRERTLSSIGKPQHSMGKHPSFRLAFGAGDTRIAHATESDQMRLQRFVFRVLVPSGWSAGAVVLGPGVSFFSVQRFEVATVDDLGERASLIRPRHRHPVSTTDIFIRRFEVVLLPCLQRHDSRLLFWASEKIVPLARVVSVVSQRFGVGRARVAAHVERATIIRGVVEGVFPRLGRDDVPLHEGQHDAGPYVVVERGEAVPVLLAIARVFACFDRVVLSSPGGGRFGAERPGP